MTRRTATQLEELYRRLGTDLLLSWAGPAGAFVDGDLATRRRLSGSRPVTDLAVGQGLDAAAQLLVSRLMTRRGELAELPTVCLTPQPAMSLVGSCCAGALRAVLLAAASVGLHRMRMLDGEVDLDPELRHL